MYLNECYFGSAGPSPADDIGQGYLTITVPIIDLADLPSEILAAAGQDPELLDQFQPDPVLLAAVGEQPEPENFRMFRNDEVAFDGSGDSGYVGYGLDIAFSERAQLALVAYTGPGLPSVVKTYPCPSAEDAVAKWQDDWAAPLVFAASAANDNDAR